LKKKHVGKTIEVAELLKRLNVLMEYEPPEYLAKQALFVKSVYSAASATDQMCFLLGDADRFNLLSEWCPNDDRLKKKAFVVNDFTALKPDEFYKHALDIAGHERTIKVIADPIVQSLLGHEGMERPLPLPSP
jgi:hypothetical protein